VEHLVARVETSNFDLLRETLEGWDHQYRQVGKGWFNGSVLLSQFDGLQVSRNHWGRRIRYRGTAPEGTIGIAVTLDQKDDARWMGVQAGSNDVIIQKCGAEADYLSSAEWDALVFAIPTQVFEQLVGDFVGGDPEFLSNLHGVAHFAPMARNRIRRLGLVYCDMLEKSIGQHADSPLLLSTAKDFFSVVVG
jgi:hypothetical protein